MYKKNVKKTASIRMAARRKRRGGSSKYGLLLLVLRSFLSGAATLIAALCVLSLLFANTGLPLDWIGPASCCAAGLGSFVSGLALSRSVERYRLLAGLGCGAFYCACTVIAGLITSPVPVLNQSNLSLLAVLVLSALAGSAAGALRGGSPAGVR